MGKMSQNKVFVRSRARIGSEISEIWLRVTVIMTKISECRLRVRVRE